jgi:hypothetical protein
MMEMGLSISEMDRRLGWNRSTIPRNRPDGAARRAWARKLRGSKIARTAAKWRMASGEPGQVRGLVDKRDGFCNADECVGALICS